MLQVRAALWAQAQPFRLMPGFCGLVVAEGCRLYLMVAVSCFTRLFTNSTLACQSVFYRELLLRSGYSYRALPQSVLYSTGICATLPLLTRREVVSVGGPPDGGICWRFDVTPLLYKLPQTPQSYGVLCLTP